MCIRDSREIQQNRKQYNCKNHHLSHQARKCLSTGKAAAFRLWRYADKATHQPLSLIHIFSGIQDPTALRGHEKSSKIMKAERYIGEGLDIHILSEEDFRNLIS